MSGPERLSDLADHLVIQGISAAIYTYPDRLILTSRDHAPVTIREHIPCGAGDADRWIVSGLGRRGIDHTYRHVLALVTDLRDAGLARWSRRAPSAQPAYENDGRIP